MKLFLLVMCSGKPLVGRFLIGPSKEILTYLPDPVGKIGISALHSKVIQHYAKDYPFLEPYIYSQGTVPSGYVEYSFKDDKFSIYLPKLFMQDKRVLENVVKEFNLPKLKVIAAWAGKVYDDYSPRIAELWNLPHPATKGY